ncbi:MAG TPA: hypothetical protein VGN16_23620 [Acidobacteriaceae bacterium]|jgi:hypothetical protein
MITNVRMSKYSWRALVMLCGLAPIAIANDTIAQQTAHTRHAATAAKKAAAAPAARGEGIVVHGHWVIDVKNPDGRVVSHRDFENSLITGGGTTSGDQILAALLSGTATAGGLSIAFISGPTTAAGMDPSSYCNVGVLGQAVVPASIHCFGFYPAGSAQGEVAVGQGQSGLSEVVNFTPSVNLVLSGNYFVPAALSSLGTINAVETYAAMCVPGSTTYAQQFRLAGSNLAFQQATLGPSACVPNALGITAAGALTSTNIPGGPLTVTAGQIITVTVTLSFS